MIWLRIDSLEPDFDADSDGQFTIRKYRFSNAASAKLRMTNYADQEIRVPGGGISPSAVSRNRDWRKTQKIIGQNQ